MIKVFTAPEVLTKSLDYHTKIFLAGSIEMNKAEKWQIEFISKFNNHITRNNPGIVANKLLDDFCIFNPRREKWDTSLEQTYENTQLYQQISWELTALERADIIYFYFDPNTTSPITLLELGKFSCIPNIRVYVNCPKGYYRKANIDIFCERYKITVIDSIDEVIKKIFE